MKVVNQLAVCVVMCVEAPVYVVIVKFSQEYCYALYKFNLLYKNNIL